jgi:hypothetical protein
MSVTVNVQSEARDAPIIECVKSGIGVVGENSSAVILYHMETRLGMKTADIAANPNRFVWALVSMFGEGAKPIFRSIMGELLVRSVKGLEFSKFAAALVTAIESDGTSDRMYLCRPPDLESGGLGPKGTRGRSANPGASDA